MALHRIRKFGVLQTAKMAGIAYLVISAIVCVPLGMFLMMFSDSESTLGHLKAVSYLRPSVL